jgi:RHS repeat-associated protein
MHGLRELWCGSIGFRFECRVGYVTENLTVCHPPNIFYYSEDQLGTSRALVQSGQTSPCFDADFFPYGGEIDHTITCTQNYKFTGKERDSESGLDNFIKRYFGSNFGRFMAPDAFYKDSHVGDPQSWNEYAYARNNPLRYVDPKGETATVSSSCSTDQNSHTTCNVQISASIAVYAVPGSGLSSDQLASAAGEIKQSIESTWSGTVQSDDITYNVTTTVNVQVAGSEAAASRSGAQNVIGLNDGPVTSRADDLSGPSNSFHTFLRGQDVGTWDYRTVGGAENSAAHEFGHLLGIDDHYDGHSVMDGSLWHTPARASASDLHGAIFEAAQSVRAGLDAKNWFLMGRTVPSPYNFSETDHVGAPFISTWWK